MDTLSLLLSMANVSANSDVLVVDMVGGLLTGAVAERLGGLLHVSFFTQVSFTMCCFQFIIKVCKQDIWVLKW